RQQEAHDIMAANTQRMKHVGRLRDARDEVAVRDDDGLIGRIGVGQESYRGRIGIFGCAEPDRLKGALPGDPLGIGGFLEGTDVGVGGKTRIVLADDTIEQVDARHYKTPPGDMFPRQLDVLCRVWISSALVRKTGDRLPDYRLFAARLSPG